VRKTSLSAANGKGEVVCFVRVAKLGSGSFVLNRNWRFWGLAALRRAKDLTQRTQGKAEVIEKEGEIPAAAGRAGREGAGVPSEQSPRAGPSENSLRARRMTMLGASSAARWALARRLVVFDIFTDSSSSSRARNAKRCVWTWNSAFAIATQR